MGVWKDLFGESKAEAWSRLADQLGGTFTHAGWNGTDMVTVRLGGYDISLDTFTVSTGKSSQTFTRMRAPFANSRGVRFGIHRASIFTGIAKALGKQDLEIGVPDFDRDFVIQGNDEASVRAILADPALRAMIEAQPYIALSIADENGLFSKSGPSVDALTFLQGGVLKDVPRLSGLFALFAALLRVLQRGGHPLDVSNAELPSVFVGMLDDVTGALGATLERVGDQLEARIDDPLGIAGGARLVASMPCMPGLTTTISLRAALPAVGSSGSFTVKPRGALTFGGTKTGDALVDEKLHIDGDATRFVRPLARLARYAPAIAVTDELAVDVREMVAHDGFIAVGAALDLWQELVRSRAGL